MQEFIGGMHYGNEGAECVFWESKENRKRSKDVWEGPRTSMEFSRLAFLNISYSYIAMIWDVVSCLIGFICL